MDCYCPSCGYNLYGIPEERCPECGLRYDLRAVRTLGRVAHHQLVDNACHVTVWSVLAIGLVSAPILLAFRGSEGFALLVCLVVMLAGIVLRRVLYSAALVDWRDNPAAILVSAMACFFAATASSQLPICARIVATAILAGLWWIHTGSDDRFEFADQSVPTAYRREFVRFHRLSWAALGVATIFVIAGWVLY